MLIVKVGVLIKTYSQNEASWLKGSQVKSQRMVDVSKYIKIRNESIRSSSEQYKVI